MNKRLSEATLLYLDDEEMVVSIFTTIFQKHVGRLVSGYNGREGISIFESEKPDIIITDINMPKMDGIEMTAHIRTQDKKTPIIGLTAHTEEEIHEKALLAGMNEIALKPLEREKLISLMEKLLNERDAA